MTVLCVLVPPLNNIPNLCSTHFASIFTAVFPSWLSPLPITLGSDQSCRWFVTFCKYFLPESSISLILNPCTPLSLPFFVIQSKHFTRPFMHCCRKVFLRCECLKGERHTVCWNVISPRHLLSTRRGQKGKHVMSLEYDVLFLQQGHT